ncbi:MAG: CRISPR system precrRNA processing endoribonuclease RAMP protein Cas6 [Bryobacteraceae bacterium]
MQFALHALRYTFRADDTIYFPPGKAGNVLRGGFGLALREVASVASYKRIFEPVAPSGPSGFADPPRPFVFRAGSLSGRRIAPGDSFSFGLHVFDTRQPSLEDYTAALDRLGREGLGPGRGRATRTGSSEETICLSLAPDDQPVPRIRVCFLSPTELKAGEALAKRPEFDILFARARDRVASLAARYGDGPIDCDFRALGERARQVAMIECDVQLEIVERRSSRTGQTHPLGGFTGHALYQGALAEFAPWLRAACWTGVGRQTVWGNGAIAVD